MRRKNLSNGSSLDLLLDTICNMFGGIVFLAILVSVLVQMRSNEPVVQRDNSIPVSAEQYREIHLKLDELNSARSRLTISVAQLRSMQGTPEDSRVREELHIVGEKKKALDVALEKQASVTQQLSKLLEENTKIVEELEALDTSLLETQAALEQKEAALDEAIADNMEVLKLPKVQTTLKASVIVLMRYGKLFPVFEVLSDTPFATHVDATKGPNSLTVSVRPAAGWSLSNLAHREEAMDYFSAHSPSQNFVSIAVWPDSFASFADLKTLLLDLKHDYQLQPLDNLDDVVIGKATELPTIQ